MKYGAPEIFYKTYIFSGQMKNGMPEICFQLNIFSLAKWNTERRKSFFSFFFSGQMKHRAPEKIGENLKKAEFRQ